MPAIWRNLIILLDSESVFPVEGKKKTKEHITQVCIYVALRWSLFLGRILHRPQQSLAVRPETGEWRLGCTPHSQRPASCLVNACRELNNISIFKWMIQPPKTGTSSTAELWDFVSDTVGWQFSFSFELYACGTGDLPFSLIPQIILSLEIRLYFQVLSEKVVF